LEQESQIGRVLEGELLKGRVDWEGLIVGGDAAEGLSVVEQEGESRGDVQGEREGEERGVTQDEGVLVQAETGDYKGEGKKQQEALHL
jgi:hypothetical protein